jgi:hypothetical protein
MKRLLLAAAVLLPTLAHAGEFPKGEEYEAKYRMSGLLVRAALACQDLKLVKSATALILSPEMKAVSHAYPETTKSWLERGADEFNDYAMTKGLPRACLSAKNLAEFLTAH